MSRIYIYKISRLYTYVRKGETLMRRETSRSVTLWASEERKIEADQCPVSAFAVNCTEPLQPTSSFFLFIYFCFFCYICFFLCLQTTPPTLSHSLSLYIGAPVSRIISPSNFQDHKTRVRLFLSRLENNTDILFPLQNNNNNNFTTIIIIIYL